MTHSLAGSPMKGGEGGINPDYVFLVDVLRGVFLLDKLCEERREGGEGILIK